MLTLLLILGLIELGHDTQTFGRQVADLGIQLSDERVVADCRACESSVCFCSRCILRLWISACSALGSAVAPLLLGSFAEPPSSRCAMRYSSEMSLTATLMLSSRPTRTTLGWMTLPSASRIPALARLATSSIAALLGAQSRIFLVAPTLPCACPACTEVEGPLRFDTNAPINAQIVLGLTRTRWTLDE